MPEGRRRQVLGIFGGTFDPVHGGHLRLAEEAADALGLPCVRWIPAGQPPLRAVAPRASARERLQMVRLAIAGNPRFVCDDGEVESERTSFTVPTLERLRQPSACGTALSLVLLVGADAFASMAAWHRWRDLFELAHVAVAFRPGYPIRPEELPAELAEQYRLRHRDDPAVLAEAPAGHIVTFAMTPLAISATRIRETLADGKSARYLLPEVVLDYIRQHSLYQER